MRRSTISIRLPGGGGPRWRRTCLLCSSGEQIVAPRTTSGQRISWRRRRTTTGARRLERPRGFSSTRARLPHTVEVCVAYLARGLPRASARASRGRSPLRVPVPADRMGRGGLVWQACRPLQVVPVVELLQRGMQDS